MKERLRHSFRLGLKELASLRSDPVLLLFVVYAFTLNIVIATDQSFQVRNASLAIVDEDRSSLSRTIAAAFFPPEFQQPTALRLGEIDATLGSGAYTFVLDIPPDFEADILARRPTAVQLLVDATAVGQAFTGSSYIEQIVLDEVDRFRPRPAAESSPVAVTRVWFNENLEARSFRAVSELLIMITVLTVLLPAAALLREREHGTIEHLLVLPITSGEILVAKIWSNALVVQLGSALSLYVVIEGFLGVTLAGSIPLFLVGVVVYQFAAISVGMLLATLVDSVQQLLLAMVVVIAPMIFLSGLFTPPESMPEWLQQSMLASPLRHFAKFGLAVLFRDAGLAVVWRELAAMAVLGFALFAVALTRFRQHFASARS